MCIDAPLERCVQALGPHRSECFVYYRVHPDDLPAVCSAVHHFQSGLRAAQPALIARLLRQSPGNDGLLTLMETYALADERPPLPDAAAEVTWVEWLAPLAQTLAPWLRGLRHIEIFQPCV